MPVSPAVASASARRPSTAGNAAMTLGQLESLESRSHRPGRVRQPTCSVELVEAVLKLREQYPRWGKGKLIILLQEEGNGVSTSTAGRIIKRLKETGVLKEAIPDHISARKRLRRCPYGIRKAKDYQARQAGDIIQLDTLDLRPLPGVIFKHFTAHDVVSKWNVMSVNRRAPAATAAHFLDILKDRMPFPIKTIRVDGGSEFESVFEQECQQRSIRLFVLPPRSLKLNGGVERAHRTHTEELDEIRAELLEWETIYNTFRPHQALGYMTPLKFLDQKRKEDMSLII